MHRGKIRGASSTICSVFSTWKSIIGNLCRGILPLKSSLCRPVFPVSMSEAIAIPSASPTLKEVGNGHGELLVWRVKVTPEAQSTQQESVSDSYEELQRGQTPTSSRRLWLASNGQEIGNLTGVGGRKRTMQRYRRARPRSRLRAISVPCRRTLRGNRLAIGA